jgi:hypothetical protein
VAQNNVFFVVQHDNNKKEKKMQCCTNGKEIKGLASGHGTHSFGRYTAI